MAGFAQYAKLLDEKTIIADIQSRIVKHQRDYDIFFKIVETLKKWNGKSVSGNKKRITDALKAAFPGYSVSLEFIGSMIYLNIWGNGIDYNEKTHILVCYTSDHSDQGIYDEEKFVKERNSHIENIPKWIDQYKKSLKEAPELVKRYNQLVKDAQKLVKDAEKYGLEYTFDIISVNRN